MKVLYTGPACCTLKYHVVYEAVSRTEDLLRVIDEEGIDYLHDATLFIPLYSRDNILDLPTEEEVLGALDLNNIGLKEVNIIEETIAELKKKLHLNDWDFFYRFPDMAKALEEEKRHNIFVGCKRAYEQFAYSNHNEKQISLCG
jgi:hypothetical protein